jgi:hypothetical protein
MVWNKECRTFGVRHLGNDNLPVVARLETKPHDCCLEAIFNNFFKLFFLSGLCETRIMSLKEIRSAKLASGGASLLFLA